MRTAIKQCTVFATAQGERLSDLIHLDADLPVEHEMRNDVHRLRYSDGDARRSSNTQLSLRSASTSCKRMSVKDKAIVAPVDSILLAEQFFQQIEIAGHVLPHYVFAETEFIERIFEGAFLVHGVQFAPLLHTLKRCWR